MVFSGSLVFLYLKIDNNWEIIGGMRNTSLSLNTQLIDSSNVSSSAWRKLQNASGLKHINIAAVGIFTDTKSHKMLRKMAFSSEAGEYKLSFPNGDNLIGHFQISHYERLGNVAEEECYQISFASSGEVNYFSD